MKIRQLPLLAALAGLVPAAASAQEFYYGGGLGYTSGTSILFGTDTSELQTGVVTLVFGQRYAAGNGFWAWETSADLSFGAETDFQGFVCSVDGADGPYLCQHDATLRLVGIYGAPIGQGMEIYGSLGLGALLGDYADNSNSVESAMTYGLTVGVGINRDFGNGLTARGEVIYDNFNRDTQEFYNSNYQGTSVRVALLRKF
jgi:Outer membrane protein beta-barrel domain